MYKKLTYCFMLLVAMHCPLTLHADGENQTPRFLAPNGVDTGDCSNRAAPCASVKYVLTKAAKADPVYMSGGEYILQADQVIHFTGDKVPLIPGYNQRDLFNTQSLSLNPVTLSGIPHYFRDQLEAKGFRVITDRKSQNKQQIAQAEKFTELFIQTSRKNNPRTDCVAGMAGSFPCANLNLMSQISLNNMSSNPSSASDIWGHVDLNNDREYAIMGLRNGTVFVDVTDAENPVEIGTINGASSTWRDIKVFQYLENGNYKAYAYITTESSQGMQIVDLNDLPNTVSLAATITSDFTTAHNIYISNVDYSTNTALTGMTPYLYIAGAGTSTGRINSGAYRVYDIVSNPTAPSLLDSPATGYVHDATSLVITDSRTAQCASNNNPCELFIDFNESTVDLWDVTNKQSPTKLSGTPYSGSAYTHSGWFSEDKQFVYIQDELDEQNNGLNTTVRVLDISDLRSPSIVNTYTGPTRAIDHNGFTHGDKYYMSNYRRGLTILDVSNPSNPVDFAYFDTLPAPSADSASFDGAWGTYPYLPSNNILVSDINNGLFVLKLSDNPVPQVGSFGFTQTALSVNEDVGSLTVEIERVGGSAGAVSLDYTTNDGSAIAGQDYTAVNGNLTWAAGDSANKSITVTITNDTDEESDEAFTLNLANATNSAAITRAEFTININSNDTSTPPVTPPTPPPTSNDSGGGSLGYLLLFLLLVLSLNSKNITPREMF